MWATPDPAVRHGAMPGVERLGVGAVRRPSGSHDPGGLVLRPPISTARIAEVQRLAKLGFKCLTLPCKPIWGAHDSGHVNYNLPHFDPLWAAIQDANLPITFHVSTGRDPRAARGNGGAVVNYVSHSLSPTIEPVANLCASGVLERFPKIALRHHRGRHRLGAVAARCHGRGLQEASLLGPSQAARTCPATTTARTASPPSRRTRPASTSPKATTSTATSCGPTTIRTTRAPGRIRPKRSSAPWASSPTARAPRCWG